jgi:hypothetical protein
LQPLDGSTFAHSTILSMIVPFVWKMQTDR